ncbi:MAG TPA: TonB-dependent receptor [Gemmatimonas sp.]|uniref:TonB-dependent receptor n=1 Tax=Gemmatimonas sp. TaxID=1962908 RepID=UPI002ED8ED5A
MQRWLSVAAAVVALLSGATRTIDAQGLTTGAVSGLVTDETSKPLEGVQIEIRNVETGYRLGIVTRANGRYNAQGLAIGRYTVVARQLGFAPQTSENVSVSLGGNIVINFQLKQAATQLQGVTISADASGADFSPSRQGVATVVGDTLLRRLPTLQRDYTDLVKLTPQVVRPADGGGASAGGVYNRYNNYTVDGVNQNDRFNLASSGGQPGGATGGRIMSIEAVKEFQVLMSPTDVRYGNFAGMLVNAVTRSGTNTWTGGATYTFRTPYMAADQPFIRNADFDVKQYGFSLGGPIIKDKLHFFVAPEFQERSDPSSGPAAAGNQVGDVSLDSIARIAQIMQGRGVDVGSAGFYRRGNPLMNLFGRLDYQINPANRLAFRQLYNTAEQDEFSRNTNAFNTNIAQQNSGIRLTSNAFSRKNTNISSALQLYTNSSRGFNNELSVGFNTVEDERILPVNTPEIAVAVTPIGGTSANRAVTFGSERFSPGNMLKQRIFEISDNLTMPFGAHTLTAGGRFERSYTYNYFLSGAANGAYNFANIADLAAGRPSGFLFSYANGGDIAAEFNAQQASAYLQDQWTMTQNFTLTYGIRADLPSFIDTPVLNNDLLTRSTAAGRAIRTDWKPKAQVLWSPRVGFNWNVDGTSNTQVRGNVGLYTAPVPLIMVGNAYSNTGLGGVNVSCTGTGVPAFVTDIASLPRSCAGSPEPVPGAAGTIGVNVTDPNFKMPQNFTGSFGLDRKLPWGTTFTFEGLYRRAVNGMFIEDINFREFDGAPTRTDLGRVQYATAITTNATGTVTVDNAARRRVITTGSNNVAFSEGAIYLTNQSKDYSYSLSGQLKKRFSSAFEVTTAYTYMQAKDVQSLTSDRAISNYRNGRQHAGLISDKNDVQTSYFERPHRIVAYGTYTAPWKNNQTDVTFYFEGMSGTPVTYTVNSDVNGDGVVGNDPIYVPRNAADASEVRIGTGSGSAFAVNATAGADYERFIAAQECLVSQRGQIMQRNSCRSPWQNRFDLSLRQSLPRVRGQNLTLQLDVINFANLVNRNWGRIALPNLSPNFPQQNILTLRQRPTGAAVVDEKANGYEFDSRLRTGKIMQQNPNQTRDFYQLQLTLRYSF